MKRILTFLLAVSAIAIAPAQTEPAGAVTQDEGRMAVAKVGAILARRHDVKLPAPAWKGGSELGREQMLELLADWTDRIEPKLRAKLRPSRLSKEAIQSGLPASHRARAEKLIENGFAAPVGPMIVGPAKGLSPEQFGDALGYFAARVEDLTTPNNPEYSPGISWPF